MRRGLRVDLREVRVDRDPRLAAGEAGVLARVPLHRRARVVAAHRAQPGEHRVRVVAVRDRLGVVVERLDVAEGLDAVERRVRHPELLALVDVRRPAVQVQDGGEHLRRAHAVLGAVVAEARDDARLVVVVPVQRVPARLREALLPAPERRLQVGQPQRADVPLRGALVEVDVLELEHHVDLAARRVGVEQRLLDRDAGRLADRQRRLRPAREHRAVHLLQVLVDPRPVDEVLGAVGHHADARLARVGQRGVLGDHVDDVHAEAVDPAVEPPAHHRVDRLADLRVLPVEVGHAAREQVQVVLAGGLVELPGRAGEARAPVVGLLAPPVPVALRAVAARARLLEPRVLGGGVVDHEVHHEPHAALVDRGEQRVEVRERAEHRLDVLVVGDVVAVVVLRRGVDGREPDHVDAERAQVVEPVGDPLEVADAVAVGVRERARVDLVDDRRLPPRLAAAGRRPPRRGAGAGARGSRRARARRGRGGGARRRRRWRPRRPRRRRRAASSSSVAWLA